MSSEKKSQDYEYDATLGKRGDRFYFYVRELQLIAEGETVELAYQELIRKKGERLDEFEKAGGLAQAPEPGQEDRESKFDRKGFGMFVLKSLVVGFILILVITFAGNTAKNMIVSSAASARGYANVLPLKLFNKLEQEILRQAQEEVSPEEQEKIKQSIKIIVNRLKPYAKELRPLFEDDPKNLPNALAEE
jgi:hypothetical protein